MLTTPPAGYRLFVLGPARDKAGKVWATDDDGNPLSWDVYATRVASSPVTDLKDENGNAITQVTPLQADSGIDEGVVYVFAPDTYGTLYVDRGQGRRVAMWPADTGSLAVQAKSVADRLDQIAQDADTASTVAAQAKTDAATAKAQQGQLMEVAATTDEVGVVVMSVLDDETQYLAVPYTCELVYAAMVFPGSIPADASFWAFALYRRRADGTTDQIVKKTTQAPPDGQGVALGTSWSLAGASWTTANAALDAGDVLQLNIASNGSPVPLPTPFTLTLRMAPR